MRQSFRGFSNASDASRASSALLDWFARARRPLPWRRSRDPYRIWIAEVLLQQTRVAQAVPYFERFVARYPSIEALAAANEDDVLKLWEGAGYYARARNLLAAARELVRDHGGRLPEDAATLARLPGVGPYIAAAVASLAYGRPEVALEANGVRVAARVFLEEGDVRSAPVRTRLRSKLRAWLPPKRPGEFNEALMELGETVCLPLDPRCAVCPVAPYCRARQELPDPGALPVRSRRRARPHVVGAVVAVERDGRFLIDRRPPRGLLGGLYEFPGGKVERGERPEDAARRELCEETGLALRELRPVGVVTHGYSHFTVELHLFEAHLPADASAARASGQWLTLEEFERLPKPRATERMIALLREPDISAVPAPRS